MIEILITIVVISFGFLALAMLQINGLKHLSGTYQHMVITSLTDSFADSMRANKSNSLKYDGLNSETFDLDCSSSACESYQLDFYTFTSTLKNLIGSGVEAEVAAENKVAFIKIRWNESGGKQMDDKQIYAFQVRL